MLYLTINSIVKAHCILLTLHSGFESNMLLWMIEGLVRRHLFCLGVVEKAGI